MGAVHKTVMMVSSLECVRKSFKWYWKFFFYLLDLIVLNSHVLCRVKISHMLILNWLSWDKLSKSSTCHDRPVHLDDHRRVTNPSDWRKDIS
jgi:hypothetical protein